ncbi:hypothetical protein PTKIN_Ptkin01aG0316800 [Pterospermum kingtungense]
MEFRPIEIKVISAKDLKDVNLFTKMDVYAVVSINGDYRTAQRTPVDKDCGSNPKWNYTMRFTIDEAIARQNRLYLVFTLKSERQLGDRDIGTVQVPIKELLDQNDNKGEHNVSYSVKRPNGKPKGVVDFSYKFGDKFNQPVPQPPPVPGAEAVFVNKHGDNDHKPVMAYPPPSTGYPAGTSSAHPYPPPPPPQGAMAGYPYPPPGGSYPPYGYQQAPPVAPGYGYAGYPPQGGYGYPPVQKPQKPKKSGMGAGLGLGLAGGLLGGMLIGDMVDDAYDAGLGDGLDFDF